jgi:hypothetical protein
MEAPAMPLPRPETTPPVMKINLVCIDEYRLVMEAISRKSVIERSLAGHSGPLP